MADEKRDPVIREAERILKVVDLFKRKPPPAESPGTPRATGASPASRQP